MQTDDELLPLPDYQDDFEEEDEYSTPEEELAGLAEELDDLKYEEENSDNYSAEDKAQLEADISEVDHDIQEIVNKITRQKRSVKPVKLY